MLMISSNFKNCSNSELFLSYFDGTNTFQYTVIFVNEKYFLKVSELGGHFLIFGCNLSTIKFRVKCDR